MTPEQFVYWLQGFAELNSHKPTQEQWDNIREHLSTVFVKVTPVLKTTATTIEDILDDLETPSRLDKLTFIC